MMLQEEALPRIRNREIDTNECCVLNYRGINFPNKITAG